METKQNKQKIKICKQKKFISKKRTSWSSAVLLPALRPRICPVPLNRRAAAGCIFPQGTSTTAGEPQNERSAAPAALKQTGPTSCTYFTRLEERGACRTAAAGTSARAGTRRLPQPPCCSRTGSSPPSCFRRMRVMAPPNQRRRASWPQPTEVT